MYYIQVNTFQTVIASDGEMTFVLFLYENIQWSDDNTRIGFDSGTGIGYNFPQEILSNLLNLESLSNIERPGIFSFRVNQDSGVILPLKGNQNGKKIIFLVCIFQ